MARQNRLNGWLEPRIATLATIEVRQQSRFFTAMRKGASKTHVNLQMLRNIAQMLAWLWVRVWSESEHLNLTVAWETSPSSKEEWTIKKKSTNERR